MERADGSTPSESGSAPNLQVLDLLALDLRARVERVVREHHLSLDRWRALQVLATRGPLSMSALREHTGITGPTLTRVIDALAEAALVYRDVDAGDRRRVVVHLSARGRTLHHRVQPAVAEIERGVLAPLSAAETEVLQGLLERLRPIPG